MTAGLGGTRQLDSSFVAALISCTSDSYAVLLHFHVAIADPSERKQANICLMLYCV